MIIFHSSDHNLQIEITIYNSLENQIINKLVWKLLLRQNNFITSIITTNKGLNHIILKLLLL